MTKEDKLMEALGRAARERDRREDAALLEAVAAGEITAAEAAARRPELGSAAELEALFGPLDEAARARAAASLPAASPRPATNPQPLAARRWARRRVLGTTLAVGAAAAAAWLLFPRAQLPSYQLSLEGGDLTTRGVSGGGAARALSLGSRLELLVRPAVPVAGPMEARLLVVSGGDAVPARAEAQGSASGAFRWAGTAEEVLGPGKGELQLIVVIGRPPLPAPAVLIQALKDGTDHTRTWQLLRAQVRIVP